jgi:hypothetical protein
MRKSTKRVIDRWKDHAKKIKNRAQRNSLIFMIDGIELKIKMNAKELGEE